MLALLALEAASVAARALPAPYQRRRQGARSVTTTACYGPNILHCTGHGRGTEIRVASCITSVTRRFLTGGVVLSIGPSIDLQGRHVRIVAGGI